MLQSYEDVVKLVLSEAQRHWATSNSEEMSMDYSHGSPRDKAVKAIATKLENELNASK